MKWVVKYLIFVGTLWPLFWTSGDVCPRFQSQGGYHLHTFLPVCYSLDSLLVWYLPTSCWPAWQPVVFPTCIFQQNFSEDSNGWSPALCKNTLPTRSLRWTYLGILSYSHWFCSCHNIIHLICNTAGFCSCYNAIYFPVSTSWYLYF